MAGRWLARLEGNDELQAFVFWFPSGPLHVIQEDGAFYLTGEALAAAHTHEEVVKLAREAIDTLSSAMSLLEDPIRPGIVQITKEDETGKRDSRAFLSGTARITGHMRVKTNRKNEPTIAQTYLAIAEGQPILRTILDLWSSPNLSWGRLYRICEELSNYLGRDLPQAGLCSKSEFERFTRSANTAEISGIDSRHASGRFVPPKKPMSKEEAVNFVRGLIRKTFEQSQVS